MLFYRKEKCLHNNYNTVLELILRNESIHVLTLAIGLRQCIIFNEILKLSKTQHISICFWGGVGLRGPIECSLLGGGVSTQNIGYRDTRLCPSIVLVYYRSIPCLQYRSGVSSCADPSPNFSSSPSDSSAALSFDPSRSITSCSHHLQDTQSPGLRTDPS